MLLTRVTNFRCFRRCLTGAKHEGTTIQGILVCFVSKSVVHTVLLQLDEMDELLSLRDARTPVRLRFGRRSDELAVPHIFPKEVHFRF